MKFFSLQVSAILLPRRYRPFETPPPRHHLLIWTDRIPIPETAAMYRLLHPFLAWLLCAGALWVGTAQAQQSSFTADMAEAANGFLRTFGPAADNARFDFTDDERFDWHFTPRRRVGVAIRDMGDPQRAALKTLMRSTLSSPGILKAEAIMALEAVLAEIEGSSLSYRDPDNYLISVFGTPGTFPWGWRLEGHHLSINVTVSTETDISITPAFMGTNPARIPSGPRTGQRVQYDEFIIALRLARSLSPEQKAQARIGNRSLGTLVAGPGRGDSPDKKQGLAVSELSRAQRVLLMQLVSSYVGIARDRIGLPYMKLVEAGMDETVFAWAGPASEVEPFYYRIHGPRILIEFDNSQGGGNHIHSLWRDPENDFGRDDLHRHYKDAPLAHGHKP